MKRMAENRGIANRKRSGLLALALGLILALALSGCSVSELIKEGITGEKSDAAAGASGEAEAPVSLPPAFNIVGDWFGVYDGKEYLALRFTADNKCELQPAVYPSDMYGPRYYGDYIWGGADGKEIILDLYKGVPKDVDYGGGNIVSEWSDGGRESATTALSVTFRVYGGQVKGVALKTGAAGVDTDGYSVVKAGSFMPLFVLSGGDGRAVSPYLFGTPPPDPAEEKLKTCAPPDSFTGAAERFYTTEELNVRCGPDTKYGTYGTTQKGTPVDKIGYMAAEHDDWAFVLLDNGAGWVNTGYLTADAPAPETQDTPDADADSPVADSVTLTDAD